ncbi:MAG: hypothetical protein EXR79_14215 [Myxococcales bacterium]|nr:hypothetical protein [Myxococcales bacterium]
MTAPIARIVTALPEPNQRLRRLAEYLRDAPAGEVLAELERAACGAQEGLLREFHLAFVLLLLHLAPRPELPGGPLPLPERNLLIDDLRLAGLLAGATREGRGWVGRILRDAFRRPSPNAARLLQLHPSIEEIPLGVRKERARGTVRERLNVLLLDTTPSVVQVLAENPRIFEPHAVQIATLRPQHPYALAALLMAPRWLTNGTVGEAVARNQATPPWLVLALAPLLPRRVQFALVHLRRLPWDVRQLLARGVGLDPERLPDLTPRVFAPPGVPRGPDDKVWEVDELPGEAWLDLPRAGGGEVADVDDGGPAGEPPRE